MCHDISRHHSFLIVADRYEVTCIAVDKESLTKDELDSINNNDYGYIVKEGYKVEIEIIQRRPLDDGSVYGASEFF